MGKAMSQRSKLFLHFFMSFSLRLTEMRKNSIQVKERPLVYPRYPARGNTESLRNQETRYSKYQSPVWPSRLPHPN